MGSNTAEYIRKYMREYRAAGRERNTRRNVNLDRPFSGCDGEGATMASGYHAYFMLRMGADTLQLKDPNVRLTTAECLDFISRMDPNVIHVGYFFDYDATKVLEDMPFEKLDRLVHRSKRTGLNGQLFPVDYAGFQVDYLPKKEFKVRRMIRQVEDETEWSPWIAISDVGSFFQMSFLRAIQVWGIGTDAEQEKIRVGKLKRATFDTADFDEIAEYNALEIVLLQELMEKFRAACVTAGYVPKKWQGPGHLAEAMLAAHGVKKTKDVALLTSEEFEPLMTFARKAYYGGRFEVAQLGPVSVPLFQNDINSAYPHAMRFVPCLQHGTWQRLYNNGRPLPLPRYGKPTGRVGEKYALQYGTFTRNPLQPSSLWYGLPVRTGTGSIVFPEKGRGWYWSFEIGSAIHQSFTTIEAWEYTRSCQCRPLGFVEEVYKARKALGKDGPGLVLKLGLNSLYGKTCQSIGFPKYANPIWASFITAYPRMMINNLIHSSPLCLHARRHNTSGCGRDIVMVATDSVATMLDRSEDIDISEALGSWSKEEHPAGMFVVQPGVYFGSSGKPTKTRGFTRTVVDVYEPAFRSAFEDMVAAGDLNAGSVALPMQIFVGIRYALQRRNLKLLGQWLDFGTDTVAGKVLSFDWTSKRLPMTLNPTADRPWLLTLPYEGSTEVETVPYSKAIGGLIEAEEGRLVFEEQPDWHPMGDTYDD